MERKIELTPTQWAKLERAVMPCMAKDDIRYYLNSMKVESHKGQARFIACDGHRLAMLDTEVPYHGGAAIVSRHPLMHVKRYRSKLKREARPFTLTLSGSKREDGHADEHPTHRLHEPTRCDITFPHREKERGMVSISEEEVVRIRVCGSQTSYAFCPKDVPGVEATELLDGLYPDYTRVVPDWVPPLTRGTTVMLVNGPLTEAMERLGEQAFPDDCKKRKWWTKGTTIHLQIGSDRVRAGFRLPLGDVPDDVEERTNGDWLHTDVAAERVSGAGLEVGFNSTYLRHVCDSFDGTARWRLTDSASSAMVTSHGSRADAGLTMVIMPMRL